MLAGGEGRALVARMPRERVLETEATVAEAVN